LRYWLPACIVTAAVSTAALAGSTGQTVVKWCSSDDEGERQACTIYITGFIEGFFAGANLTDKLCLPDHLKGAEATAAVRRLLHNKVQRDFADALDSQGATILLLKQAYPCRK
jgi:hypothetical protein